MLTTSFGSSALGNTVSISYISGIPIPEKLNDPDLVVIFRSMLKTSTVTKERGLNDLLAILRDNKRLESLVSDTTFQWQWVLIYPKLAIDVSLNVRLLAQQAQGIIYKNMGKKASKYLKDCIGPWLCGLYDSGRGVPKAVQDSLELVFSSKEKRDSLWSLFSDDLLRFVHTTITIETQGTLYDERYVTKEESSQSYYRVIQSCVSVLAVLILTKKTSKINNDNQDASDLLHDSKFWKIMYCGNSALQKSVLQFARGMVVEHKDVLLEDIESHSYSEPILVLITSNLVKCCNAPSKNVPGQVVPDLMRTIGFVTAKMGQDVWEKSSSKGSSKAFKAFENLLSQGSRESNSSFWKELSELLASFGDEFKKQVENSLLAALHRETFAATIEEGVKALLTIYDDNNMHASLVALICLSDHSFGPELYNVLQKAAEDIDDDLVSQCLGKDKQYKPMPSSAGRRKRLSHIGKLLTITGKSGPKLPKLDALISETLSTFSINNIPLVCDVLSYGYNVGDDQVELFLKNWASTTETGDDILLLASKIANRSPLLQDTLVSVVHNILNEPHGKQDEDAADDSEDIETNVENDSGISTRSKILDILICYDIFVNIKPISELQEWIYRQAKYMDSGSEIYRNMVVFGILSHDVFITKDIAFDLLYLVANSLLSRDPDSAMYILISVTNKDKEFISSFCRDTSDGKELLLKLYDVGNSSADSLLQKLTDKSEDSSKGKPDIRTTLITEQLSSIDLNHVDSLLEMADQLWQSSTEELVASIKSQLSEKTEEYSVPLELTMKYDYGILTEKRVYRPVSDETVARAIFMLQLMQQKNLDIDNALLLELALLKELVIAKEFSAGNFIDIYPSLSAFVSTIDRLVQNSDDSFMEMLMSNDAASGYSAVEFYKSRVLERAMSSNKVLDPRYLISFIKSKNAPDFQSFAIVGVLKNTEAIIPLRNEVSASMINVPLPDISKLVWLNALLDSEKGTGASIPINRLLLLIKTISSWLESPEAYDLEFLPMRTEITLAFYHIAMVYSEMLTETHWVQVTELIEQNIEVVLMQMEDSVEETVQSLSSSLNYWTLKLLEVVLDNLEIISTPPEIGGIFDQLIETVPANVHCVQFFGQQFCAVVSKIPTGIVAGLNAENVATLYSALKKARTSSITRCIAHILESSICSKQEDISIEYQLDTSVDVSLPQELLDIISDKAAVVDKLRFLLAWRLIMCHFEKSTFELRRKYIEKIQEFTGRLLDTLFAEVLITPSKSKPSQQDIAEVLELTLLAKDTDATKIGLNLFFMTLSYMHSVVRSWYLNVRRPATSKAVEDVTKNYFTNILVSRELESLDQVENDDEFRVEKRAKDVRVFYKIDEEESIFEIHYPDVYPLQDIEITNKKLVGITDKIFRGWSASMRAISVYQSGRLVEILSILRKTSRLYFEGAEECAICYALVHRDLTLPEKTCSTCKKKFHTDCLYRWFKSSNDSACPLCRSKFNFKTRVAPHQILV